MLLQYYIRYCDYIYDNMFVLVGMDLDVQYPFPLKHSEFLTMTENKTCSIISWYHVIILFWPLCLTTGEVTLALCTGPGFSAVKAMIGVSVGVCVCVCF